MSATRKDITLNGSSNPFTYTAFGGLLPANGFSGMPPIFTGCLRKGVESPKVTSTPEVSDLSGPAQPVEPFQQRKRVQTINPVDASMDTLHLEETLMLVETPEPVEDRELVGQKELLRQQQLQEQMQMDEWRELLEACEALLQQLGAENDAIAARPTPPMIMPDGTPYSPPPHHHRRRSSAGAYSRERASYMPDPHRHPHGLAHQAAVQNVRYPPQRLPAVFYPDGIWQPLPELCIF